MLLTVMAVGALTAGPHRAGAAETIKVSVIAILATDKDSKVDPGLEDLARCVKKQHPEWKLTGFRLHKVTCKEVEVGSSDTFDLDGTNKATVALKRVAEKGDTGKKHGEIKVTPPRMGAITYKCCCGKFFPILTPVRTRDGEVLIMGVCVKPCYPK